jgi:uncharacterized protein YbjT (DUF2867 family)
LKLLVLGATGRYVVDRAVRAGDTATALARTPAALDDLAGKVTVVAGDATSPVDVAKALAGQYAAICALGRATSIRADECSPAPPKR